MPTVCTTRQNTQSREARIRLRLPQAVSQQFTSQPSPLPISSFGQQPFCASQRHSHGVFLAWLCLIQSLELGSSMTGQGA
jgi:hypothetical protein